MEIPFLLSKDKEIQYQEHSQYVWLYEGERKGKEMKEGREQRAKGNKLAYHHDWKLQLQLYIYWYNYKFIMIM